MITIFRAIIYVLYQLHVQLGVGGCQLLTVTRSSHCSQCPLHPYIWLWNLEHHCATKKKRLRAFDNNCLRSILNIHWAEGIRNDGIYSMTNHTPIVDVIRKRRWMYWGHMVRMGDGRLPHDIWCWTPPGLRKSGRPKMTICRILEKGAKLTRSSMEELWLIAQDGSLWRTTVAALCAFRRGRT